METNEQGLTFEEKIMFGLLGIILIVAIGVLTIKSFSDNERVLEETPIKENVGQQNNIDKEENTNTSDSSLIEETSDKNALKKYNTSYTISKNNSLLAAIPKEKDVIVSKPAIKVENDTKEENTNTNIYDAWDFKENIVTKAYSGDKIIIDKNVLLSNGNEATAQLTVRKLVEDTYMIINIEDGFITVTPGTYKYYYTYANVTKELVLTVYDYIDTNNLSFLNLKDEIIDDSIKEEELNSIKNTLQNTTMSLDENTLNITVKQTKSSSLQIPIVATFNKIEDIENVKSSTIGVVATKENNTWYQELLSNQILLWINADIFKSSEIKINIDGIDYVLNVNVSIVVNEEETNIKKDESEGSDNESEEEIKNEDKESSIDEGTKPDDTINDIKESETVEITENNIVNSILENITESSSSIT